MTTGDRLAELAQQAAHEDVGRKDALAGRPYAPPKRGPGVEPYKRGYWSGLPSLHKPEEDR